MGIAPSSTTVTDLHLLAHLQSELRNFEEIAAAIRPQPEELPRLDGIDIFGGTLALNGKVGGDHIIYLDFKRRFDLDARIARARADDRLDVVANLERCRRAAGVAVIDAAGHRMTDALPAAMLHQAFLLGAVYELDLSGRITGRLLENLNARFHDSPGEHKFISLMYGEISDNAMFRFISAAQPFPAIFSARHDTFMEVSRERCVSFPPLGLMPSVDVIDRDVARTVLGFKDGYQVNEWLLMGSGDILVIHTDGLLDLTSQEDEYFPGRLEDTLRRVKHRTAAEIFAAIECDIRAFAPQTDDISIVVVKRM